MINLRRNDVDLPSWHLEGIADMAEALDWLKAHGYRGALSQQESGGWKIELNTGNQPPVTASIGDWLVWDMGLRHITASDGDAAEGYHTGGE